MLELVKQSELEKFAVRKDTPFIEVIDNPKAPLKLEHINNFKHLILGGALGLMISIFLIFTLYFLKKFNA